ncbi:MAG: prepilin peptidase [Sphingomonadaceae bacterium]
MNGVLAIFLLFLLAALLVAAAIGDWRSRTIRNRLTGAIALGAIPYWLALGLAPWPDMALQIAIAALLFGLFALAFAIGAMGGGDVKLIAALALWLPPRGVMEMLVAMALAGGALTCLLFIRHRLSGARHRLQVPYGVAISFAGLWVISEPFLNQFR